MLAVLLDFNGTMFFDTSLHMEAWSKIYQELHPEDTDPLDTGLVCGANNAQVLMNLAPWLTDRERDRYSIRKEELYRQVCKENPEIVHLTHGTETFLDELQRRGIPFALASASIMDNIRFYFDTFGLDRWFRLEDVVYDDGTYPHKGAMHMEAARRLGVDISEFIRNQAIFKNMADGFGVAEEQAYKLSKGLTELAYDMSSFYNVNMEEVFQRLQSGVAGEIEPVRRWGIALDQASMKQWMLQKGIDLLLAQ